MADNYLEKQYESYEARKAAWEKAKKQGRKYPLKTETRKIIKEQEKMDYDNDIGENVEE